MAVNDVFDTDPDGCCRRDDLYLNRRHKQLRRYCCLKCGRSYAVVDGKLVMRGYYSADAVKVFKEEKGWQ